MTKVIQQMLLRLVKVHAALFTNETKLWVHQKQVVKITKMQISRSYGTSDFRVNQLQYILTRLFKMKTSTNSNNCINAIFDIHNKSTIAIGFKLACK